MPPIRSGRGAEFHPGVPTIAEAGVPGCEAVIWLGLIASNGTPPHFAQPGLRIAGCVFSGYEGFNRK
jgi:hypothetical protein